MKERMINSKSKRKRLLLLALLGTIVLFPFKVTAGFAAPIDTQEVGIFELAEADKQPTDFSLVEHQADFDYETQLSTIFYCTAQRQLYFAGVKFIYGSDFEQEFGDLDSVQKNESDVFCETLQVDQWVTGIEYYLNNNLGMLGFKMYGHDGATYQAAALGSGVFTTSAKIQFTGPPMGMRMLFTDAPGNGGSWDPRADTPFAMQAIVNNKVCDFSFYLGGQGPRDMETDSVSGTPDEQIVVNQDNFITKIYGQDCGKTAIEFGKLFAFMSTSTDPVTGDHTVRLESLENQIGLYDIVIILKPDDPFILIEPIEYHFQVFIHPCVLDDLIITPPEDTVVTIGQPEIIRTYSWEQIPNCQYPVEVVFVSNTNPPPTYMLHDIDNQQIRFPETQDLSFAGDYPVAEMNVRVYIPTDYTYKDPLTENFKDTFKITIIDPCPDSDFVDFTILDEQIRVFVEVKERPMVPPADTVSLDNEPSGISFCGPRVYQFDVPSLVDQKVVLFDAQTMMITFQSNKLEEVGEHNVFATVALEKYPRVRKQVSFKLNILSCEISAFTAVDQIDQLYNVFTGPKEFTLKSFEQEPACEYDVEYTYEVMSPVDAAGDLPDFVDLTDKLKMLVESDDIDNLGDYLIKVKGRVVENPDATIVNFLEKTTFFTILMKNGCLEDVIEPVTYGIAETQEYVIGTDNTKEVTFEWVQDREGCPTELAFVMIDTDTKQERAMTPFENQSIKFTPDQANLRATIQLNKVSDFGLDEETWTMRALLRSIHSEVQMEDFDIPVDPSVNVPGGTSLAPTTVGELSSYEIAFSFIDQCWLSQLTPGQFSFTKREYFLHDVQELQFTEMEDTTLGLGACGGYTYDLEYVQGPVSNPSLPQGANLDHYLNFSNVYTGSTTSKAWIGTHKLRLKCTNGNKKSAQTRNRGEDQLFNTVYSDEIELVIKDPCAESRVNQVSINNMLIRFGATLLSQEVSGPTDTASLTYGNGYDICGPMKYSVLNNLDDVLNESWFEFEYLSFPSQSDKLSLTLKSEPEGSEHNAVLRVKAELADYPSAKPAYIPFNVKYRGCFYDDFTASYPIPAQIVRVRDFKRLTYAFDQTPCVYPMSIDVSVIDQTGQLIAEPDFLLNDPLTGTLDVVATEDYQVGKYIVNIEATLQNILGSEAQITFILNLVSGDAKIIDRPQVPDLDIELFVHTQRVRVGYSPVFEYKPSFQSEQVFGFLKEPGLDLGLYQDRLEKFVSYDAIRGLIVFDGPKATREDIGTYELRYYITFSNQTMSFDESYNFTLLVTADELIPDKVDPCQDDDKCIVVEETWEGKIIEEDASDGDFNADAPIPTISYVSPAGLVTISWDREMLIPEELDPIALEKIGLRDYENHTNFGKGVGLARLGQSDDDEQKAVDARRALQVEKAEQGMIKIVDALELRIAPRDGDHDLNEEVSFNWTVESFEPYSMQLQLYIEEPSHLSKGGQIDSLFVTFYDVSYFKAKASGQEVRQNTELSWDLVRMISESEMETVHDMKFFYYLTIGTLVVSIPMSVYGSLLPTWTFVHSLQIVAHTPLLNSEMPGNVQYFLSDYLKIVRLRDPVYDEPAPLMTNSDETESLSQRLLQAVQSTSDQPDNFPYASEQEYHGAYNNRFLSNGYAQLLATNLVVYLYLALVIVIVWAICELKDCIQRKRAKRVKMQRQMKIVEKSRSTLVKWWMRPWGPFMSNVLVRLTYVMFLEICICSFLTVSYADMGSEDAAGFQWFVALFAIFAMIAMFAGLVYLWFRRGPYIRGFYEPGLKNFWRSYWQIRPLGRRYEAYAVDGRGSDDIYFGEDFEAGKDDGKILLRVPPKHPKQPEIEENEDSNIKAKGVEPLSLFDEEMPPTSRDLLGEDPPSARDPEPGPIRLGNEMMRIIGDNQGQAKNAAQKTQAAKRAPRLEENLLPDQNTEVRLDSLDDMERDQDQTIPQIHRDSVNSFAGTFETARKADRGAELFEGGEGEQAIVITNEDESPPEMVSIGTGMDIDPELDRRQKRALYFRRLSRKRQTFVDDTIKTSDRYSTLWLGLRKNHERKVALVHPISFLARRVSYAFLITALAAHLYTNVLGFMLLTFGMLAYACYEHQWEHWLVDQQHIVNEVFIYFLSITLLIFGSFIGAFSINLGWFFIALVCLMIVYNAIVVLRFALRTIYVIVKKVYVRHIRHRLGLGKKSKKKTEPEQIGNEIEKLSGSSDEDEKKEKERGLPGSPPQKAEAVEKRDQDACTSAEKRRIESAMREIETQTDDFNGYFARFWAWFCDRFLNRRGEDPGDFFTNDQNELSFGKKREGDEESMRSSGTFGGPKKINKGDSESKQENKDKDKDMNTELALKTLKLNMNDSNKLIKQQSSPNQSDIFNKSAAGVDYQATDQQLLGHKTVPLKDSIDEDLNETEEANRENLEKIAQKLHDQQRSSINNQSGSNVSQSQQSRMSNSSRRRNKKKKAVTKLTHPVEHLDPKRQINLLESSGLSDAIEANLANQSLDADENKNRGSMRVIKDATRNIMGLGSGSERKLQTMPSQKKLKLSQGSMDQSSTKNIHSTIKKGEEMDENGNLIKSGKMFESGNGQSLEHDSQKKMQTIPQSEIENSQDMDDNSQLLRSGDFTGDGDQVDIRKVIADGENDGENGDGRGGEHGDDRDGEHDGDHNLSKSKKKRKKSKGSKSKRGRQLTRNANGRDGGSSGDQDGDNLNAHGSLSSSQQSQQLGQRWLGSSAKKNGMGSTIRGSSKPRNKKKMNQTTGLKNSINGSIMEEADYMTAEQMRATMGPRPKRVRGGLMDGTAATRERQLARLREPKKEKYPPMRYTNQGQTDKKDDGARPLLPEEQERLEKELEDLHQRSTSESAIIKYSRLQASRMKSQDLAQAKRDARKEAMKSMQSLDNENRKRRARERKIKNFALDRKGETQVGSENNDSMSHRRRTGNHSLLDSQGKHMSRDASSRNRPGGATGRSRSQSSHGPHISGSGRKSPHMNKLATITSKVNSTDGFKKSNSDVDQKQQRAGKGKDADALAAKQGMDTSEDIILFQGSDDYIAADNLKGLTTIPNEESVLNEIAQDSQLQIAIQHALTGQKDKEDANGMDKSQGLIARLNAGPGSSILSDWDDLDGQSGSNYQHQYFYNKKKPKGLQATGKKGGKNADNDSVRDQLRKRYGLGNKKNADGTNSRSRSGFSPSQRGQVTNSTRMNIGKTPTNKNTPGFHGIIATNKSRDTSRSPRLGGKNELDGIVSPNINNFNMPNIDGSSSPDLEHLVATAAFGGAQGDYPSIPENAGSPSSRFGASRITPSGSRLDFQKSKLSSNFKNGRSQGRHTSMGHNAEMYVPINLDGQMVQILNTKGKKHGASHRNAQSFGGDFSVYANAFEKKLTADQMNFSRQKTRTDRSKGLRLGGSHHNGENRDQESYMRNNTYIPQKQMTVSPTTKMHQDHISGQKALENYLNDVPIPDPTSLSTGKMVNSQIKLNNNNLNFQLGGDGVMANEGHQALQSRLTNLKKSKLFQTVIDGQIDQNRSSSIAPQADNNSFTAAAVTGTPYQSSNQQNRQQNIEKKQGTRTGLRLQQAHRSILPDETSEGNRQDLLNGIFFPGKLSINTSREGSVSGRSHSDIGSVSIAENTTTRNNDAMSNRHRMKSLNPVSTVSQATSRLGANKAAGASIIENHGCMGKRYCSVSDMSDNGRNGATSRNSRH